MLKVNIHRLLMEAAKEGDAGGGAGGGDAGGGGDPAARAAIEARAKDMGWSPRDQWRGSPERWVDADVYVRRGEEIMPILQANSRKSEAQIQALSGELQKTKKLLVAAQESIEVLTGLNNETNRAAAKEKRKELLRAQVKARADGDADLEVELGEQIEEQTAAIQQAEGTKSAKGTKKAKAEVEPEVDEAPDPMSDPIFKQWAADNPWFGVDEVRTATATAVGKKLRNSGEQSVGRPFFDKVSAEVSKIFDVHRQAIGTKVEGGHSNGGGGGDQGSGGGSHGKSWNDLPADAKAAAERQAAWVVGEGRAFKDLAAWKKHYVSKYFE